MTIDAGDYYDANHTEYGCSAAACNRDSWLTLKDSFKNKFNPNAGSPTERSVNIKLL